MRGENAVNHTCPECGVALEIPDEYAGQRVGCESCNAKFVLPLPTPKRVALFPEVGKGFARTFGCFLCLLCLLTAGVLAVVVSTCGIAGLTHPQTESPATALHVAPVPQDDLVSIPISPATTGSSALEVPSLVLMDFAVVRLPQDYDENRYTDQAALVLEVGNNTDRWIKAWQAIIEVRNVFDDLLFHAQVTDGTTEIPPRDTETAVFTWEDNPFIEDEPFDYLTKFAKDNLRVSFTETKISQYGASQHPATEPGEPSQQQLPTTPPTVEPPPMPKYERISEGMDYALVAKIMEAEGEKKGEAEVPRGVITKYEWPVQGVLTIHATFVNDSLTEWNVEEGVRVMPPQRPSAKPVYLKPKYDTPVQNTTPDTIPRVVIQPIEPIFP